MTAEETEHVQSLISEAMLLVALDHINPADVEKKLFAALQPYFKGAKREEK